MDSTKLSFSYLLILASIATNALAEPQCTQDHGWDNLASGTQAADVCGVAQNLMNHCKTSGPQPIEDLPPNPWYKAWNFPNTLDCACTKIMYNLLSACAGCQKWDSFNATGQTWLSLADYEGSKCQSLHDTDGTIPVEPNNADAGWNSTTVPPWSRELDGTTFNLAKANALVNVNDGNSSAASSTTTGSDPAVPTVNTSTPVADATSSKSGPNVGAIAGGVIGGLAFLGAIIGLLLFLRHRKRRARDVAPSDEFLKPEYYASPPLLPVTQIRRDSDYRDDIEEEAVPPIMSHRLSWAGGLVATRRRDDEAEEGEMLPPFTQGTYIGPSPHEKGYPERRQTDESDTTVTSNTHLLPSPTQAGTSESAS